MKAKRGETAMIRPGENAMANPLTPSVPRETSAEVAARETLRRIKAAEDAANVGVKPEH